MVAIKDMEMPRACTSTQEILGDIGVVNCPLYNVCKHRDTINVNCRPTNCPLVEIEEYKGEHEKLEKIEQIVNDKHYSVKSLSYEIKEILDKEQL